MVPFLCYIQKYNEEKEWSPKRLQLCWCLYWCWWVWTAQTQPSKKELWTYFDPLDHNSKWSAISILQILKWDLGLRNTSKDKHLNTDFWTYRCCPTKHCIAEANIFQIDSNIWEPKSLLYFCVISTYKHEFRAVTFNNSNYFINCIHVHSPRYM